MATVASGQASFRWITPPSAQLIPNTVRYGDAVLRAIHAAADAFASQIESFMKATAPWNDQTGAARAGLRAVALKSATGFVISAFHSVFYGVYLEFGTIHAAPRPIIRPALQRFGSIIMAAMRAIVGG